MLIDTLLSRRAPYHPAELMQCQPARSLIIMGEHEVRGPWFSFNYKLRFRYLQ